MRSRIGYQVIVVAAGAMIALAPVLPNAGAFADSGSAVAERRAPSACTEPAGPVTLSSVAQVEGLLVGVWIRCEGPSVFGQVADGEVGMAVEANGSYYRLYQAADGSLLRADGLDQEGAWSVLDTTNVNGPGGYQVNWTPVGRGTFNTIPAFFESPPSFRLNESRGSARYERWTGVAPVAGLPPGAGNGPCGHPTGPITLSSVEQVRELLVGTWILCGDTSVLGDPADEVGLEFTADGLFYRLVHGAGGRTIRAVNEPQRSWTVTDITAMNGPGWYQVDLLIVDGGSLITRPVFLTSPPFVHFLGIPTLATADYVRGEPPSAMPATGNGAMAGQLESAALIVLLGVALRAASRAGRSERFSRVSSDRDHEGVPGLN